MLGKGTFSLLVAVFRSVVASMGAVDFEIVQGPSASASFVSAMWTSGSNLFAIDSGARFYTFEVSATQAVKRAVVTIPALRTEVSGMTLAGRLAYVACGGAGLQIVDVSNPTAPTYLGGCDTQGFAADCVVSGDFAYVADGVTGVQVINIQDPAHPQVANTVDTAGTANGLAVQGRYLYVADLTGIRIMDLSMPSAPVLVGSYPGTAPGEIRAVRVRGNYAYTASGPLTGTTMVAMEIVDISDPQAPKRVGSPLGGLQQISTVALDSDYAYLASSGEIYIVDVSNPAAPMVKSSISKLGNSVRCLAVASGVLFEAQAGGIESYKVVPSNYQRTGEFPRPLRIAKVRGNLVYGLLVGGGAVVMDVLNPAAPILQRSYLLPEGYAADVSDQVFAVAANDGVYFCDPASSTGITKFAVNASLHGLAVTGRFAYVVASNGSLDVVDVSDRSQPRIVAEFDDFATSYLAEAVVTNGKWTVLYEGHYVFHEFYSELDATRLRIFDATDPAALRQVGEFAGGNAPVSLMGDLLWDGFTLFDLSDPANVKRAGPNTKISDYSGDGETVIANGYLYSRRDGLTVFSLKNPFDPVAVARVSTTGGTRFRVGNSIISGSAIFPRFLQIQLDWTSGYNFKISGPEGVSGQLQSSSDLLEWNNREPVSFNGAEQEFATDGSSVREFYRVFVE